MKMFEIDPFKEHVGHFNYSLPVLKKKESKRIHYSQLGFGLKKQLDLAKSLFKKNNLSESEKIERKFHPFIPVKNFKITSTQFQKYLMLKNVKSEKKINHSENFRKSNRPSLYKNSSNYNKYNTSKPIREINENRLNRNNRLSLDFITVRSVYRTDNFNMNKNMVDERNKLDNLMNAILDNNRTEKMEIRFLASQYNKNDILEREKKRRNIVKSINNCNFIKKDLTQDY